MHSRHTRSLAALFIASFTLSMLAVPAQAALVTYDPSLGTLPESQGFTFSDSGGSPAPTVSGAILHQGPTSTAGLQFWSRNDFSYDFTAGFSMALTLKVLSSNYDANAGGPGSQRSGYYVDAIDNAGRRFALGIAATGVTLNTDAGLSIGNGIPFTAFDTTDAAHTYRLDVAAGTGSLFIDNNLIGTTPVGGIVDPGTADRMYFGDGSGGGTSQTELSFFQYTAIPEPTHAALLALAALAARRRRRGARA